jgi:hypothetical protein
LATRQDLPERSLGLDFSIPLARTSDRERKVFLNIFSAGLAVGRRSAATTNLLNAPNARSATLAGARKTFAVKPFDCLNY